MLRLTQTMFDTKLPPGVVMLQPFSEESSIKKIAVKVCLKTPNFHHVSNVLPFVDNSIKSRTELRT